jgi:hypothetical protein
VCVGRPQSMERLLSKCETVSSKPQYWQKKERKNPRLDKLTWSLESDK